MFVSRRRRRGGDSPSMLYAHRRNFWKFFQKCYSPTVFLGYRRLRFVRPFVQNEINGRPGVITTRVRRPQGQAAVIVVAVASSRPSVVQVVPRGGDSEPRTWRTIARARISYDNDRENTKIIIAIMADVYALHQACAWTS